MRYIFIITFLFYSLFSVGQWVNIGPFFGQNSEKKLLHSMGLVSAVHTNPQQPETFIIGTSASGIWKTKDGGINWKCTTDDKDFLPGLGISFIASNPKNPNTLLASTGHTVYGEDQYEGPLLISYDNGDSWTKIPSFKCPKWYSTPLMKVVYHTSGNIYVLSQKGLFISYDNANSWKEIFRLDKNEKYIEHDAQSLCDFEVFENGNILLSSGQKWGASASIWHFNNANQNWKKINHHPIISNHLKNAHLNSIKISSPHEEKAYIGFSAFDSLIVFKTDNNAENYYFIGSFKLNEATGSAQSYKFEMEHSYYEDNTLYFGFTHFFKWSPSEGLKQLSSPGNMTDEWHVDVRNMKLYSNDSKEYILMGNDGGPSKFYPDNNTFEGLNGKKLPITQVWKMGISQISDNQKVLIGTQDNGTFEFSNNEWIWKTGGDGGASWISKDGQTQISTINGSARLEINENFRTRVFFSPISHNSSWFINFPLEVNESEKMIYWGSAERNSNKQASLFSYDVNLKKKSQINLDLKKIGAIGLANNNPVMYISDGMLESFNDDKNVLLKSSNYGKSFENISNAFVYSSDYKDTTPLFKVLDWKIITDIEIDPEDPNHVFICLSGYISDEYIFNNIQKYRVLESDNGGNSWIDITGDLPSIPCNKITYIKGSNHQIILGTDDGIFHKDGNTKWKKLGVNFPKNTTVTDIAINYFSNEVYASTYGRGVWKSQLPKFEKTSLKIKDDNFTFTDKFIYQDIKINRKNSLKFSDTIWLAKDVKIILESKSELILDNATIHTNLSENELFELKGNNAKFFLFRKKKGEITYNGNSKIIRYE